MQPILVLEVQNIVQKFFKPDSEDFILFLDDGVTCPSTNPFATDKGHVPVSAICFDCKSFKGFFRSDDDHKSIFCKGKFEIAVGLTPSVRDYLDPIEQEPESFWNTTIQSVENGISSSN